MDREHTRGHGTHTGTEYLMKRKVKTDVYYICNRKALLQFWFSAAFSTIGKAKIYIYCIQAEKTHLQS